MNIKRKVLEREDTHRRQSCKNHGQKLRMPDIPKDRNYVSIRLIPTDYSSSVQRRERVHFKRAENNNNYRTFAS